MPLPDFLLIPGKIISDELLQPLDGLVYGIVYWYSRQKLEKCIASNQQIADLLHGSISGVSHALTRLSRRGYVKILLEKETNQRLEIIPLVAFTQAALNPATPLHDPATPLAQKMPYPSSFEQHSINSNNNINTTPIVPKGTSQTLNKKEDMEMPAPKATALTDDFIAKFNTAFKSDFRVTKARADKLKLRLKTYKYEEIVKAMENLSRSKWHQGDNERGWKADPDFFLRTDEQIDKWLQKNPLKKMGMGEASGYQPYEDWLKTAEAKAWGYKK